MIRRGRSERTIESYRDRVERIFAEWLDSPLQELGLDPAKVVTKHDDITKENGPYTANGSMRTLRAIYNHARKSNKSLPADNPVNAIDWNGEQGRDTGMGTSDLKGWFAELAALDDSSGRTAYRGEARNLGLVSSNQADRLAPYRTLSSKLPELGKLISAARQDRVMPSNALRLASRRRQVDEVEASDTF
jgi:hypothetical protein